MWSNSVFVAHQAVALFKSYFGGAFDEDAIRNNFVLIYELLDGMICLLF
jgi:AP-2 complex subunit mu-1